MNIHNDLANWLHFGPGWHWGFLIGDLKDGLIFDIIDHVRRWFGRYPGSLMNIWHDLAEKKFVPGWGLGVGVGLDWVFSKLRIGFSQSITSFHLSSKS